MKVYKIIISTIILSGCAAVERVPSASNLESQIASANVIDRREAVSSYICSKTINVSHINCVNETTLPQKLSDNTKMDDDWPYIDNSDVPKYHFVSGIFGECFSDLFPTFDETISALESNGFKTNRIQVKGRGSVLENSSIIISEFGTDRVKHGPHEINIVVGYSKGGLDILEALERSKSLQNHIDAILLLSVPIFGTPEIEISSISKFFAINTEFEKCDIGSDNLFEAIGVEFRNSKMMNWSFPSNIQIYSLATAAVEEKRVSLPMRKGFRRMIESELPNDGQVPFYSQMLPESTFLGVVPVDHWELALNTPFANRNKPENQFLRSEFLPLILEYIAGNVLRSNGLRRY